MMISVPSGHVIATHRHPTYGHCVIDQSFPVRGMVAIRTATGTALVPSKTVSRLA